MCESIINILLTQVHTGTLDRFLPPPAAGMARVVDTTVGTAATAATDTSATDTATTTDAEMDRDQWVPDPSLTQQVS